MSSSKRPTRKQKDTKKNKGKDGIDVIFEKMDLNHDGRISVYELTKAARLLGLNPTAEEAEQIIKDCNPSQPGYVNKFEFRKLFNDRQADIDAQIQEITDAFRVFDKDNSGTISADEIREVLRLSGEDVSEEEIKDILKKVDVDGDGNISIEEFASVMCDLN